MVEIGTGVTDFLGPEDVSGSLGDGPHPGVTTDRKNLHYYFNGTVRTVAKDAPGDKHGYTFYAAPPRGIMDADGAAHYAWKQDLLDRKAPQIVHSALNNWFNLRLIFSSLCCLAATLKQWWSIACPGKDMAKGKYLFFT